MSGLSGMSVVFDLDGTLVDSEPNYFEAGRQVLAEHGVPDFAWADHERYVGISTLETVTLWKREYGLRASVEELLAAKNRRYLELARTATRAYPEMRKFVELLATEGVPMAVASGAGLGGGVGSAGSAPNGKAVAGLVGPLLADPA
ncbi:HAD family hydrolase, partial [Streptomyces chartreusis]